MVNNLIQSGKSLFLRKQTNILSAASVIMAAVLMSRILGLLRLRLMTERFFPDAKWQFDVYIASFRFPDMIFELLVLGALSAAFIPVFSEYLEKNKEEAYRVASSVINILSLIFGLAAVVMFIFAPQLSHLIAPSYGPEKIDLLTNLTRLMLFAQVFFCISNFLTGIIQSNQRFLIPALAPIVYNIGIILGIIFLVPIMGIYGASVGVIFGALLHLLIQLPLVIKLGFVYHWRAWDYHHPGFKEIAKLMAPRTLALAVSQVESTVSVFLTTFLIEGSVSLFYFAQTLMNIPIGLFGATIGQAALPSLSQSVAKNDLEEYKKNFLFSFFQTLYLVLPLTAILLILRIPAVRIAYGVKGFAWSETLETGKTLALFSAAIVCQSVIQILIRGFYALHNTKTPLVLSLLAVLTNIVLSTIFIFKFKWGIGGLAFSASIVAVIQTGLLLLFLDRQVKGFNRQRILSSFGKIGLATATMGLFLWVPMRFLDRFVLNTQKTGELILLTIIATLTGTFVYLLLSIILKIEEFQVVVSLVRKMGRWREILGQSEEIIENTTN
ncbi:murein biosynthesis integral membrane protein MurJ [Candidatus Shapirobacteria bacterium CG08_land_8_20_14_0_20_39_18]|uniref:Probable lipid II flippase MurJ n=1 Tax=Candidatus Shapirobacteria bacterium CG08_land_8_20_14_0_20_39_18 TaxID=1974883 RepID=A0A2M6XCM4_9BACT|nr:MAG: murein biosynthesis integral membrane protein MurJ [Candidatus Shapirobacteria bacterium CG08_land_8_20_14_0_20_39_18]PIY66475.1 MAG: murein biosynthesis integral membrane protein MurJ [Candidatus Shapirobacteria bacterium CG_4_10_14_0_8_um_filter_39_15]